MSHVQPGINDIATTNPQLASEWDYDKNGKLLPSEVSVRSNKKVWWKCKLAHSWEATPDHRYNGRGCPICSGKIIVLGFNDLKTRNPQLASEWNNAKNGDLSPDTISLNSHQKIWWKCYDCGHEWQATPNDRARGRGCPLCARKIRATSRNKSILASRSNNLLSHHQELLVEWDYEKNETSPEKILAGSQQKVWWKCKVCGNSWNATINNRVRGSGCPKCMKHAKTSFPEQAILYYIQKYYPSVENSYSELKEDSLMELDIYIPERKIGIEYDGVAWHNNSKSLKRDQSKYLLCQQQGISLVRVSEFEHDSYNICDYILYRNDPSDNGLDVTINKLLNYLGINDCDVSTQRDRPAIMKRYITHIADKSISIKYPDEVKYWDVNKNRGLLASQVNATSNVSYWWTCDLGHSYKATPSNRLGTGNGCPICSGKKLLSGFNDLATIYPQLSSEWDIEKNAPLTPAQIYARSTQKVWWKCSLNHSYYTSPSNRVYSNSNCPYCKNIKVLSGFNDLKTLYPDVAKKWAYSANATTPDNVLHNSHAVVTWVCNLGHTWKRSISAEIKSDRCPVCADTELLIGFNDLKTAFPSIAAEWNYDKNNDIPEKYTRLSRKLVWWKCQKCGNEWQSKIYNRTYNRVGCPSCGYSSKMQQTRLKNLINAKQTFADLHPDMLSEWDYAKNAIKPTELSSGANKKIWWLCPKGHSYQAWLTDRTGRLKTGCPYCAGKRRLDNITISNPEIANEWDFEKNGKRRPEEYPKSSKAKVWWMCPNGHSYESVIKSRTDERHPHGCPYCSNKKVLKGYNDLQTRYPAIAMEWDYSLNEGMTPDNVVAGSGKKVWWSCSKCGHKWQKAVVYRTFSNNGCPECNRKRLSKAVICLETGLEYSSIKEAASKTDLSVYTLTRHLKGLDDSANGTHWKYI